MFHKTWFEKAKESLIRFGKKHKYMKLAVLLAWVAVFCVAKIQLHFVTHGKRYLSAAMIFVFCAMSCSFSFPALAEMSSGTVAATGVLAPEKMLEQQPEEQAVEFLDDADVLDGYEDAELGNVEELDRYTLDEILEENPELAEEEGGIEGEAGTHLQDIPEGEGAFNPPTPHFDKKDWKLLLINKQHPIPEGYTFELGTIKGSMKCDKRILEDLLSMLQGAREDGVSLVICSPYRDLNRQEVLFNRKITAYMGRGMSYMEAYKTASQAVTVPGASEHQIGLALDIITDGYSTLDEGFGETKAGKWLAAHSCEYGFILRYPKDKEYITSIEYEPWHFRYVGKDAAMVITRQKMTLEEFVETL